MKKIFMAGLVSLLLQGCLTTMPGGGSSLNRGGQGMYAPTFYLEQGQASKFSLIKLKGLPVDDNIYKKNEFIVETAYSNANQTKKIAVALYAIKKDKAVDLTLPRHELLKYDETTQLIWFKKTPSVKNKWAVRVLKTPYQKSFIPTGDAPEYKIWSHNLINAVQKKLTNSQSIKSCYSYCTLPPMKYAKKEAEGWGDLGYQSPQTRMASVGLTTYSMNYDEFKTFKELIILPVSIYSDKEHKGASLGGSAYRSTRSSSVFPVDIRFQKQIASVFGSYVGKVKLPNKSFTKTYYKLAEEHADGVGKASIGELFGKGRAPAQIVRENLMADVSVKNTGVASIDFRRGTSDFKNRLGKKNTHDLLMLSVGIWDSHQVPPSNNYTIALAHDDTAAMLLTAYFSVPINMSTSQYIKKNKSKILKRLQAVVDCRIQEYGIEIEKVAIDFEGFDDDILAE